MRFYLRGDRPPRHYTGRPARREIAGGFLGRGGTIPTSFLRCLSIRSRSPMSVTIPRWLAQACTMAALLALTTPARAGFGVGPTSPIDPLPFSTVGAQDQVAASDNGTVTLFAWRDTRHGGADLFAARVTHAGQVLDPNGIELAAGPGAEGQPALAWNGTRWLVAWTDRDPGSGLATVRALRVGADGQPVDPAPLALSTPGADASH